MGHPGEKRMFSADSKRKTEHPLESERF